MLQRMSGFWLSHLASMPGGIVLPLAVFCFVWATFTAATQAQLVNEPANYQRTLTISESSYNHLLHRLEALESYVGSDEKESGCKEIEILEKPTLKVSGRVHFDYWGYPDESPLANFLETGDQTVAPLDFIGFRRLRMGVRGKVNETMEYKLEMEFAAPNEPTFKDAYLGWNELPILRTVLLGNQKRPYGLDHLNSSRYNVFMERPFHVEAINQDARRFGLQSYGLSDDQRWNWRYGVFLMDDLSGAGFQRTDNYQSEIAGRIANTIWYDETSGGRGYAHWAISGSAAFPGGGGDGRFRTRPEARTANRWIDTGGPLADLMKSYQLLGFEGVLNVGRLSVVGEYQVVQTQQFGAGNLNFSGGYVYVAYWLTDDYTPWSRKSGTLARTKPLENFFCIRDCDGSRGSGWGAWQIAGRYSHGDFSDGTFLGGVGDSFTLGLNWWWNPYGRVQFNYIHGSLARRDPGTTGGTALPAGVGTSGDYDIFGARFMVDF